MTFAVTRFLGLGIEVTDIWLADNVEDPEPDKHIWLVFHLPFCRVGFII